MTSYCMSITVMLLANKLQSKINRTVCYKRRCVTKFTKTSTFQTATELRKKILIRTQNSKRWYKKHSKYKKEVWRRKRLKWITIVVLKTS